MSISTTSARSCLASLIACLPVAASPTTVRSGALSTIIRSPARTSSWSSASSTRVGGHGGARASAVAPVSSRRSTRQLGQAERRRLGPSSATTAARSRMPIRPWPPAVSASAPDAPPRHAPACRRCRAPCRRPRSTQRAVVFDRQRQHPGRYASRTNARGPGRVLRGVGQRLLDHPVRGEVDRLGQRPGLAGDLAGDLQAGGREGADQLLKPGEPAGRLGRLGVRPARAAAPRSAAAPRARPRWPAGCARATPWPGRQVSVSSR